MGVFYLFPDFGWSPLMFSISSPSTMKWFKNTLTPMFSAGLASVWVDTSHKQQFERQTSKAICVCCNPWLSLLFCDCGSAEKLLRPPNAIIPFPLSASYLSGPFCYPASSQIASSPVSAFILSPPCLGSKPLPSSDSIKRHNFSSCGSNQIGWLMHFSCVLSFFFFLLSVPHIYI